MVVQSFVRPASIIPGSMKMCIPVGDLTAPDAAPLATLGSNLNSSAVTAHRKSGRIITRLKLHAEKGTNHFGLCLVQSLGRMHLIRPPRHPVRSNRQHCTIEEAQLVLKWSLQHGLTEIAIKTTPHAGKSGCQAWLDAAIVAQNVPKCRECMVVFMGPVQGLCIRLPTPRAHKKYFESSPMAKPQECCK